jgi:DNA-directed RNA polymerase specialized sigma24 family protein
MRDVLNAGRRWSWAACAVAVAAVVSPSSLSHDEAIDQMQRYCNSSWQRAGISHQDWEDCTQETVLELLARIGPSQLPQAILEPSSEYRQQLKRCIWCTVKRWQRIARRDVRRRDVEAAESSYGIENPAAIWNELLAVGGPRMSRRESRILRLSGQGWSVTDIAGELDMTATQVSRAKYKAICKLRALVS